MANIIASVFIVCTISAVTMFGAETPTKMSAPTNASANFPFIPERLVTSAISFWAQFKSSISFERIPYNPQIVTSLKP